MASWFIFILVFLSVGPSKGGKFYNGVDIIHGDMKAKIFSGWKLLQL